jgi:hypothetical protein
MFIELPDGEVLNLNQVLFFKKEKNRDKYLVAFYGDKYSLLVGFDSENKRDCFFENLKTKLEVTFIKDDRIYV